MVREDIRKSGYSAEEEYFYKLNKELIEKKRRELDAQREEQEKQETHGDYWMVCPKCGGRLEEISLAHILVDRCTGCQGIFFDHGELETLLESREPKGFLDTLKGLFT